MRPPAGCKFVDVRVDGVVPARYFVIRPPTVREDDQVWVVRGDVRSVVPVNKLHRVDASVFLTGGLAEADLVAGGSGEIAVEWTAVRTVPDLPR